MAFRLQALLDLRKKAEKDAEKAVSATITARAKVEARQKELDDITAAARQKVKDALEEARAAASVDVNETLGRDRYRKRLAEKADVCAQQAQQHRNGPLAQAIQAEKQARAAHLEARKQREALEKHREKVEAEERLVAERRNEDIMSDLAIAAHFRKEPGG